MKTDSQPYDVKVFSNNFYYFLKNRQFINELKKYVKFLIIIIYRKLLHFSLLYNLLQKLSTFKEKKFLIIKILHYTFHLNTDNHFAEHPILAAKSVKIVSLRKFHQCFEKTNSA